LSLDGGPARREPDRWLALVASGGHSSWYLMEDGRRQRLGRTRDDAAGECFDKVAQVLGLGYPGGPAIDRLARRGDSDSVALPRPQIADAPLDFSFSGLKSATIRAIRERRVAILPTREAPPEACDLAASFEAAVIDQLLRPLDELAQCHRPQVVAASGGVAANTLLRQRLEAWGADRGIDVLLPPTALTTDNAAMIGYAGQIAFASGRTADPRRLDARARAAWQPPGMRPEKVDVGPAEPLA
jgi:N6-L-threonylcarbamoyladenine synthase